jgi:homoserine dehydrogenase
LAKRRKTVMLVSRGQLQDGSIHLQVMPEVLDESDMLATAKGSLNLLLLHTDVAGTVGTMLIDPGVRRAGP